MRKIGTTFLFACLLIPPILQAQSQPVSKPALTAETITLGNSAVTLPGPWKFAPGDSPWQNGAPLWAQPGFDDASWATMDLAPKAGSVDPGYGTPGFVRLDGTRLSQSSGLCLVSPARACHGSRPAAPAQDAHRCR